MSCNTDDTIEVQDENVVIENSLQLIQFKDVPREIVGEITNIRENLNEKSSSLNQFGEIDRNATVIRINTTQDDVSHTLLLNNRGTNGKSTGNASADIYFDNLYITTHEGTVTDKHIIRYIPDSNKIFIAADWSTFNGYGEIYNVDGILKGRTHFENGLPVVTNNDTESFAKSVALECTLVRTVTLYVYGNAGPPTYFVECTFGGSGFNGGNRGPGGNLGNGTGDTGSGTSTSGGGSYGDTGPGTGPNTGDAESDTLDKLEKRNREIRERALKEKIEEDSFLLLDVPCDEIPKWQPLAQHEVSTELVNKIDGLFQNDNDWAINSLENASGAIVNMDYFAVNITKMPPLSSGSPLLHSPKSLLRLIRSQLNNLSDEASFDPYCFSGQSMCDQETALWNSFFPLGAILSLDLAMDDGSVMVTKFDSNSWYFTTLEDPKYGDHPVAGTRQFGFEQQADGSYDFFVRGVDRIDSRFMEVSAAAITLGNRFGGSDNTWTNFQQNLVRFLNEMNPDAATIVDETIWRPDWDDVQDILNGNKPISDLDGCE